MLNIILGQDLDGYQSPRPTDLCGQITLGPLGLLELLELRLGLRGLRESEAIRVVQYLGALRAADDGQRFYSRSLAVDELAVARTLLDWRDTLVEAGWSGATRPGDSRRLKDLAAVESLCQGRLAPGRTDRLRAVAAALLERPLPELSVELQDPRESFPAVWQQILSALNVAQAPVDAGWTVRAPAGSDLARLQEALLKNQPIRLQGDGTVLALSAHNETLLGRAVSQILHGTFAAKKSSWFAKQHRTTLIAGNGVEALELAFEAEDHSLTGSSTPTRWRPPLQVLPLVLSLLWEPLDPHRLLEFLTHPICPLPGFVRHRLANVVAEFPGIGGTAWVEAIAELQEEAVARAGGDPQAAGRLAERIEEWLGGDRFVPETGVPLGPVAERCAKVARWASSWAAAEAVDPPLRDLLLVATSQATQAQQTLDAMARAGQERIGRLQLERLMDQLTFHGGAVPGLVAECGHSHLVHGPGAVVETNERILWWNFLEPSLPHRWPWSPQELSQLAENGARLPAVEAQLQNLSSVWLRPVFAATRQLILAAPRTQGGEGGRRHPLRDRLEALTSQTIPELDVAMLLGTSPKALPLALATQPVSPKALPGPVRWWQVKNPKLLSARDQESFSSLQAFIESPYQWVLRYKGRLRPAALSRIDDGSRQRGNLLHRFFERIFEPEGFPWKKADRKALTAWIEDAFPLLLVEEGANFLLPGRLKDRQELLETAQRTAWTLLEHLRAAKVVAVELEKGVEGTFVGGELTGYIDMLLTNAKGEEAVLDLKWGSGSYRQKELKENRALQLALYARLRKSGKRWPAQGYYILSEGRLLAQDRDFFPSAEVCAPAEGESAASLWLAFEKTWKWRRAQLDKGLIEVTVTGTEADKASVPPTGALEVGEHNDRFNDFAALTGWPEGA